MLVYRVEHPKTGVGPYNCSGVSLCFDHCDSSHPNWGNDHFPSKLFDSNIEKIYAGFISLDQLFAWFNEKETLMLKNSGFIVAIYESENVYSTSFQAVFFKEKATLIEKIEF